MLTLSELANLAADSNVNFLSSKGGQKAEGKKADGPFQSPLEPQVAYPVHVTPAVVDGKFGKQLEVSMAIITSSGSLKKAGKTWLSLETSGLENKSPEEALKIANNTYKNLHGLLAAIDPATFTTCASIDKRNDKKWKYIGHDGKAMTQEQVAARKAAIEKAVVGAAMALAAGQMTLPESDIYVIRVPKNTGKGDFFNYYHNVPESAPLAEV